MLLIYIVQYITGAKGVAADTPSISIALNKQYNMNYSIVHEIGHCFGLHHTHETDFGIENIERSGSNKNCEQAGDKLCSTPADPQLFVQTSSGGHYKVDNNCNYTENETRNGISYNPNTHNFMSYSRPHCLDSFTLEQVDVMRAIITTNSILQPTISDLCRITGSFEVCNSETYTVGNSNNIPVTWSVSPNLKILPIPAPTNTSVTVAPKYPSSNGIGYVQAQTSSQPLQKEVWIGSPNSSSSGLSSYNGAPVDTDVYMQSNDIIFAPDISIGAHYEWEIAYNNNSCLNNPNAILPYFVDSGSNHLTNTIGQANIAWGNCPGTFSVLCYAVNSCGDRYIGMEMVEVHGFGDPEPCDDLVINVYPNPSNSVLHANIIAPPPCDPIEPVLPPSGFQATIYDFQGNPQYSENFNSSDITIENMNLNQGNYILNIQTTTGQSGQEIIVVE